MDEVSVFLHLLKPYVLPLSFLFFTATKLFEISTCYSSFNFHIFQLIDVLLPYETFNLLNHLKVIFNVIL